MVALDGSQIKEPILASRVFTGSLNTKSHHFRPQKRAGTRRERTRGEAVLAGGTYNASSQPQHRAFDKKQFQFLKIEVFLPLFVG